MKVKVNINHQNLFSRVLNRSKCLVLPLFDYISPISRTHSWQGDTDFLGFLSREESSLKRGGFFDLNRKRAYSLGWKWWRYSFICLAI